MRRFLNFCLLLVVLASVGFVLYRAKLLPLGRSGSQPVSNPTPAPVASRESLRISVSHRPEALLVSALKRLLEAENRAIEVVPFDPESSWLELAAGELDLVVAPLGEAVTAQARFQAGKFLFASGMSQGYDLVLSRGALESAPKTLGISGSEGGELFAVSKFPEARLISAENQKQLQSWLSEGAVQAAVLESASLPSELRGGKTLTATSVEAPVPTVVVLSRAMSEEGSENGPRVEVLLHTLESWNGLIGYLANQPDLLRSALKPEADELGVDLDVLLKDYRFLTPNEGRDALLSSAQAGGLKQTFDLLVLARTANLSAPDWSAVLELPVYLQAALPGGSQASAPPSPSAGLVAIPTPQETPTVAATRGPAATGGDGGTHHFAGAAPGDPWPEPLITKKVAKALSFAPALAGPLVGVATEKGFVAFGVDGKQVFEASEGGAPLATPVGADGIFYLMTAGTLSALDGQGKAAWTYTFEGTPGNTVLLTPSEVVFTLETSAGYQIVAVSKQSGEATWQDALSSPPASPPVLASGPKPLVLLVDETGAVRTWDARSGSAGWQTPLPKPTFLSPAALGDALAVSDSEGGVRLLSLADGSQSWEVELGTALAGSPTLTETLVLVPANDTYLYALDRANGEIKGKLRLAVPLSAPAVVVDDHAYCVDELGGVHSISLPGLKLNWSQSLASKGVPLNGPVFSADSWAALADDGSLFTYPR